MWFHCDFQPQILYIFVVQRVWQILEPYVSQLVDLVNQVVQPLLQILLPMIVHGRRCIFRALPEA